MTMAVQHLALVLAAATMYPPPSSPSQPAGLSASSWSPPANWRPSVDTDGGFVVDGGGDDNNIDDGSDYDEYAADLLSAAASFENQSSESSESSIPPTAASLGGRCTDDQFTVSLYGLVAGVVCVLGLLGNSVSIGVLAHDAKTPAFSFQLVALAAADNLLLALWFVHYSVRYSMRYYRVDADGRSVADPAWLSLVRFYTFPVVYMAQTATIWLTVVIAFNRYMAVCWPYKAPRLQKVRIVHRVVVAVVAFSIVYNMPRFVFDRTAEIQDRMSRV